MLIPASPGPLGPAGGGVAGVDEVLTGRAAVFSWSTFTETTHFLIGPSGRVNRPVEHPPPLSQCPSPLGDVIDTTTSVPARSRPAQSLGGPGQIG